MNVHAVGTTTGSAEDAPGLQPRNASPAGCSRPGIGDNLYIHAGAAVLQREVGPPVADPAARGKRSVERDVVGVGLPRDS